VISNNYKARCANGMRQDIHPAYITIYSRLIDSHLKTKISSPLWLSKLADKFWR